MEACGADCQCSCNCITLRSKIVMENKNVDLVAKDHLNLISEALKKEGSVSSYSIPDELEFLRKEARAENCKITPGMLVYDNKTPSLSLYHADKEGCYVLHKAEMRILKEQIERMERTTEL